MSMLVLAVLACTSSTPSGNDDSVASEADADADTDADNDADSDADTDADSDADSDTDTLLQPGRFFPDGAPWYQDVSKADVDSRSDDIIAGLQAHGWGSGDFQMDLSIDILEADSSAPRSEFTPTGSFYSPDCDQVPVPLPKGGNVEGEDGYECLHHGDCHLIVAERDENKLYEMWKANVTDKEFRGGCLAVWDMTRLYPPEGRGDQCSSADAAGFPIAPLLFTADEVAAGHIDHAIRFAIPNDDIDNDVFFHPASHGTDADADGTVPYGARFRLKPDFDVSRIADPDARVVVVALQKYGMFLADGGNIPLMGTSDRWTKAKWDDLFEDGTHALFGIEPQDFEVIELEGSPIDLTYDCVRNGY
jgi:hypothetical protein